mgnify:CR=1 FL=1
MLKFIYQRWWKYVAILLMLYVLTMGFLYKVPDLDILNETIRALHFHVPMWFGMMILFLISLIHSIRYLRGGDLRQDLIAVEMANVGILFGVLGLTTGMVWANYTWGDWWNGDPKQNMSAILLLIYFSYSVLRSSISDPEKRGRISAVYNIFAFCAIIPLLFIIPRIYDSLHPSNGGNEGFVVYDLDNSLRLVFYPAVIGFTLIAMWAASLRIRTRILNYKLLKLID